MSSSKIYFDLLSKPDTRNFICGNICLWVEITKIEISSKFFNFPVHKVIREEIQKSIIYFKPMSDILICECVALSHRIQKWQPLAVTLTTWKEASNNKAQRW